jgi:hypothetical protein
LAADKRGDNLQQHCSSTVSRNPKKKIMYEEKIFDEDGVKQKSFKTSMLTPDFDDRSPENIRKVNLRKKCSFDLSVVALQKQSKRFANDVRRSGTSFVLFTRYVTWL